MPGAQRIVGEPPRRWEFHAWHGCGAPGGARSFPDRNAAVSWLLQFRSDPFAMAGLRALALTSGFAGVSLSRASDDQVLESLASLLARGVLHVHRVRPPATAWRTAAAAAEPSASRAIPPSRSVTAGTERVAPAQQTKDDADTFSAQTDGAATAAVLRSAASSGVPFCEECAKAAAAKKAA